VIEYFLPGLDPALVSPGASPTAPAGLALRYLGTAGFVLSGGDRTIVLDPFLSRPGLLATGLRPLVVNRALLQAELPHADAVLVGHAHHDHVLDAPDLCLQTGAQFFGSPDACNVARAAGLPERQIVETQGRDDHHVGAVRLRALPAAHGRVYFNRVTLPGSIPTPPPWPPRITDLRHGLVLNWLVEVEGVRVVHVDSAEFHREELLALPLVDGRRAEVACLCAIGRRYRPRYLEEAIELLRPHTVVACHWDWFFTPWGAPPRLLPGVDLAGFVHDVRQLGSTPVVMPFGTWLGLSAGP
jgi:L-ascorbate metabolism protein UlaG (beta-lactamase superfamily)